jgi:aryl-alcohol dehydrogenase-like predicted oxidoreductase
MNPVEIATGLYTSRLGLGTMTFGDQVGQDEAERMVRLAVDRGVNFIDTANVYAKGQSEQLLGRLLSGRRDEVVLASKVGIPVDEGDRRPLSAEAVRFAIESSLRRLRTDHLDLYYVHQPDPRTSFDETMGAMDGLVQEGLVRHIGVSNYAAWQIAELRCMATSTGSYPLVEVAQQPYNLLSRDLEREYADFARHAGVATVAYNPLAGGLLTGKHRGARVPGESGRFAWKMYRERYWSDEQLAAVDALWDVARDAGLDLLQLALRWVSGRDTTSVVLLGASSYDHLEQNLRAADEDPLHADVLAACDRVWDRLQGAAPSYHR